MTIAVYGSRLLRNYTRKILIEGLRKNSADAHEAPLRAMPSGDAIFQIHGAPQSEREDMAIMKILKKSVPGSGSKNIVVLHRPDEAQKFSELRRILLSAKSKTGLVFFGSLHTRDAFFPSRNIAKKIIPHGFFRVRNRLQYDPVIIGTHTTWGEMRSVDHELKTLLEIFRRDRKRTKRIVGYLGGKPGKELSKQRILELCREIMPEIAVDVMPASLSSVRRAANEYASGNNTILVGKGEWPPFIDFTFNVQIYRLGARVRTGESSGTIHRTTGIPVVLEMNGAEKIEELEIIKVPYSDHRSVKTANFGKAAEKILDSIYTGRYRRMLRHNLRQSAAWNSKRIGREYIKFFGQL